MSILQASEIKNNPFLGLYHMEIDFPYIAVYSHTENICYYVTNSEEISQILANSLGDSFDYKHHEHVGENGRVTYLGASKMLLPQNLLDLHKICVSKKVLFFAAGTIKSVLLSNNINKKLYSLSTLVVLDALGLTTKKFEPYIEALLEDMERQSTLMIGKITGDPEIISKYFSEYKVYEKGGMREIIIVTGEEYTPAEDEVILGSFNNTLELLNFLIKYQVPYKKIVEIIDQYNLRREFTIGIIKNEEFESKIKEVIEEKEKLIYSVVESKISHVDSSLLYYTPGFYAFSYLYNIARDVIEDPEDLEAFSVLSQKYADLLKTSYFSKQKLSRPNFIDSEIYAELLSIFLKALQNNKVWIDKITEVIKQDIGKFLEDSSTIINPVYQSFISRLNDFMYFLWYNEQATEVRREPQNVNKYNTIKQNLANFINLFEHQETKAGATLSYKILFDNGFVDFFVDFLRQYNITIPPSVKNLAILSSYIIVSKLTSKVALPLFVFYVFEALSKYNTKNLTNLKITLERKRKSHVAHAVVKSRVDSEIEIIMNHLNREEKWYGPLFSLSIFYLIYNKVVHKKSDDISAYTHSLIEKIREYRPYRITVANLENIHKKLISTYSYYALTDAFYGYLNDKRNLLTATLYPHQEKTSAEIEAAYMDNKKTGFLLAHATGSGKTITIAKAIDNILKNNPDAKVLFLSKSEIVNKIASELPFVCEQYNHIDIVENEEDLRYLMDNHDKISKFTGVSYTLLVRVLNDDVIDEDDETDLRNLVNQLPDADIDIELDGASEENKRGTEPRTSDDNYISAEYETEDETEDETDSENLNNTEDTDDESSTEESLVSAPELLVRRRRVVKHFDIIKMVRFLQNFDVLVIDEAHYIKNLNIKYVENESRDNRRDRSGIYGVNFMLTPYRPGPGTSRLALAIFLSKYLLGKTIFKVFMRDENGRVNRIQYYIAPTQKEIIRFLDYYNETLLPNNAEREEYYIDKKRIFYLLSSGTVMPNWPQDLWVLLYLIGVRPSFRRQSPHDFSSHYFGSDIRKTAISGRNMVEKWNRIIGRIVNAMRKYNNFDDKRLRMLLYRNRRNLERMNIRVVDFIKGFKAHLKRGYANVLGESDAVRLDILRQANRKVKRFMVSEKIIEKVRNVTSIINSNISKDLYVSQYGNAMTFAINSMKNELNARQQSNKKGRKSIIINTEQHSNANFGISYALTLWDFLHNNSYMDKLNIIIENVTKNIMGSKYEKSGYENEKAKYFALLRKNLTKILYGRGISFSSGTYSVDIDDDTNMIDTLPSYRAAFGTENERDMVRDGRVRMAALVSTSLSVIQNYPVLYMDVHNVKMSGLFQKSYGIINSLINTIKRSMVIIGLTKMGEIMKYIIIDNIKLWLDIEMGKKQGNGKIFIATTHILVSTLLYLIYIEFMYNIRYLARTREVNLIDVINKLIERSLVGAYGFGLAVSVGNIGLDASDLIEIIEPLLSKFRNTIDKVNSMGITPAKNLSNAEKRDVLQSLCDIIMLTRISKFVIAFTKIRSKEKYEKIRDTVIKYLVGQMYVEYGESMDIFNLGSKSVKEYIGQAGLSDSQSGEFNAAKYLDGEIIAAIKNNYDLFSYMVLKDYITEEVKDRTIQAIERDLNESTIRSFSNMNINYKLFSEDISNLGDEEEGLLPIDDEGTLNVGQRFADKSKNPFAGYEDSPYKRPKIHKALDSKVNITSKKKLGLSHEFMNNPDLQIVIANSRSIAEGLNFSNASAMYIIEMSYSAGLFSQIEARINRINTTNDFDITYVLTNLNVEESMANFVAAKDFISSAAIGHSKGLWNDIANAENITPDMAIETQKLKEVIEEHIAYSAGEKKYNIKYDQEGVFVRFMHSPSAEQVRDINNTAEEVSQINEERRQENNDEGEEDLL